MHIACNFFAWTAQVESLLTECLRNRLRTIKVKDLPDSRLDALEDLLEGLVDVGRVQLEVEEHAELHQLAHIILVLVLVEEVLVGRAVDLVFQVVQLLELQVQEYYFRLLIFDQLTRLALVRK